MDISPAELAADLRRLRRGRGAQAPRLADEVGPALRALCGVRDTDSHAVVREKVRVTLRGWSEALPVDLRAVFVVALALDVDVEGKFLGDRERSLAVGLHRDVRTIRRRVEEAIDLFAENAAARAGPPPGGDADHWHVERLEALVRLDVPEPECVERWTIVAARDIGDHVRVAVSPPCGPTGDGARVRAVPFFGVEVAGEQRLPDGRLLLDLRLPRALRAGQRHECGLVVTTAAGGGARSHHLYRPERRCETFELTVRFPAAHVPAAISPVRGSPAAGDGWAAEGEVVVDAVHEAHAAFEDLRSGNVYGIRWRPEVPGG
ncbi:hypothetical protein LZG04_24970 [Saccharothrix sp. S26]|uniref:hypothetical protein n=1 Tax=Saccharothrix sp. S26 TaxID=2907215 RepID=UPI001F407AD7|nr:hypothetical protein [Saccharothrix sp. S26]MCE6998026.1 hypothetical protein [Saccharothrix sp. S26]